MGAEMSSTMRSAPITKQITTPEDTIDPKTEDQ